MEVLSLLSDDVETDDAAPGENLKLRLKGIEEEEILPGFILCTPENLCHSGRTFDAQVKRSPFNYLANYLKGASSALGIGYVSNSPLCYSAKWTPF